MEFGNLIYLVLGAGLACGLVAIGIALGFLRGKAIGLGALVQDDIDRQGVLAMLRDLGTWTQEYSGNVSMYQSRLGELSELAKRAGGATKLDSGVASLLNEIMQSNTVLQKRLDAAEKQLENQTRQIESYLTEARTDGLTKLANRRAFDSKIEELFSAYRKGGKSFVVVIIDIDHFKKINDTYGHPVGDEVLRQVASLLSQSFENAYILARYGGEEFVMLLASPLRVAADRVDSVRKLIAAEPLRINDKSIQVTLSGGVAEPREEFVSAATLRRADEALYVAKNIGRNRVYYHDGRQAVLVGAPEVASGV